MPNFLRKKEKDEAPKSTSKIDDSSPVPLIIKRGKLVRLVSFSTIKFLTGVSAVFLIVNIGFSLELFSSSVSITNNLGAYINMISKGDGHILPSLQAIPVLFFLIVDFALMYFTYKLFDPEKKPNINKILFMLLMVSLSLMCVILLLLIVIIQHIYGSHEELHNGIIEAMKSYGENSMYKKQIDRLQIEFQCCGSKKYDEWYNITWFDSSLAKNNASDSSHGHTPFSCCSMTSIFPCIHHNIETTGKVYLYTPELNLSISTEGCYSRIRHKKQIVGWSIVGNLCLYIISQKKDIAIWLQKGAHCEMVSITNKSKLKHLLNSSNRCSHTVSNRKGALVISLRFVQTGHYENFRFEGHKRLYTVWLIGCYAGRKADATEVKEAPKSEEGEAAVPPEVPPLPPELMQEK